MEMFPEIMSLIMCLTPKLEISRTDWVKVCDKGSIGEGAGPVPYMRNVVR